MMTRPAALVLLAFTALLAGCDRNSGDPVGISATQSPASKAGPVSGVIDRSHKGRPLPAMTFSDPDGRKLDIASLKGRPVLINLWATWCGPCVQEMPTLERIAADNTNVIRIITISQDAPGAPVKTFLAEHGLKHLEPWLDPEGRIDAYYATGHFPTTVFYGADGREVWRFVGSRDWSDAEATAMLVEGTLE